MIIRHCAFLTAVLLAILGWPGVIGAQRNINLDASFGHTLSVVQHVIVIVEGSASFDSLYGNFPGANGRSASPSPSGEAAPGDTNTEDFLTRFYHHQLQINLQFRGGKMGQFAARSDNPASALSSIDAAELPEGLLAKEFVLCDNFFQSSFGGSFLNHQYLIAAAAPRWPNAPPSVVSNPDPKNLNDAIVTPDGYAVNTVLPINAPHPENTSDPSLKSTSL